MKGPVMRHAVRGTLLCLVMALSIASAGCNDSLLGLGWNLKRGDISKVEKGWNENKVKTSMGKPLRIIPGKGTYTGWEEWIYEEGSIFFYRMDVENVVIRQSALRNDTYQSMFDTGTSTESLAREAERFRAF